jgi:hypothetical protein
MTQDTEKTIKRMTVQLFRYPIDDYLSSENFSEFCREHDLSDAWKEKLESSRDRPDLYGRDVMKNALVLFLNHISHCRPDEFLALFTWILAGFSQAGYLILPLDALKRELLLLGYSDDDIEHEFANLKTSRME